MGPKHPGLYMNYTFDSSVNYLWPDNNGNKTHSFIPVAKLNTSHS